jgi:hypothetical protein
MDIFFTAIQLVINDIIAQVIHGIMVHDGVIEHHHRTKTPSQAGMILLHSEVR